MCWKKIKEFLEFFLAHILGEALHVKNKIGDEKNGTNIQRFVAARDKAACQ